MTERALKIFVAGTVNGCTDLQNANFTRYHRFVRFEARGKSHGSDGHRYYANLINIYTQPTYPSCKLVVRNDEESVQRIINLRTCTKDKSRALL